MNNLHVTLDEANKHTPKGFDPAVSNTRPWKDEQSLSTYTENMELPKAINFVDGTVAPPTTGNLDAYVLTGAGVVDAGWGTATFGDWVRFTNAIAAPITPLTGYLCFDSTASAWKEFDGSVWAAFGGGVDTNLGTDNLTLSGATTRTYNIDGNELKFIDGANNKIKITSSGVGVGNIGTPAAQLHVQGSGSTSGTTALLVQNSLGTDLLEVKDDGTILGAFPVGAGSGTDSFQTNGVGSSASALYAIALGFSASASGGNGIAIGNAASGGTNGIGIGALASSSGAQSVAIGTSSSCAALDSVALGRNSIVVASATYGLALGFSSVSSGGNGIAIGNQSLGGANGIGIGAQAKSASDGISIGCLANSSATKGISFGFNMKSTADYALMFGGSTAAKTNATSNSLEVNFNEATSTIRLARSADSWINTSSNFGIGTNTPSAKLDVNGSTLLNGNLGLFGTTPVAQPTTAIIAPAQVQNGGITITDTDTFEGYTLSQIVKAMRTIGILA